MNKFLSSFILLSAVSLPGFAGNHVIEKLQLAGPVSVRRPVMVGSVDINGNAFDELSLLSTTLATNGGKTFSNGEKLQSASAYSVASLSFDAETTAYTKATLTCQRSEDKQNICGRHGDRRKGHRTGAGYPPLRHQHFAQRQRSRKAEGNAEHRQ